MSRSDDGFKFFSKLFLYKLERTDRLKVTLIDTSSTFPAVFHFSFLSLFIILLLFLNFKLPNVTPGVFRSAPTLELDCAPGDKWGFTGPNALIPCGKFISTAVFV